MSRSERVLRALVAASVMLSGVVHLELWAQGMNALAVIGPAFLVNAVAGIVLGVALVVSDHWLPVLASVGFGAATLGAFVVSTTVGLFGVREQWRGAAVWLSAVSEVAAMLLGAVALLLAWRRGRVPGATAPLARTAARGA